ncbi:hypothetical protein HQ550_03435 [bacterium]|nr:hypothetical protein [bacterium]
MKLLRIFCLTIVTTLLFCFFIYALDKDFKEERSTHFIVYYKEGIDRDFIEDIIDAAEGYYEEIADDLGYRRYNFWLWDERAHIYIFPDKTSYQKETRQPDWSGGCASYRDKKIWTYPHAAGFFDSILPHELGHIIFREFVGFKNEIPLWFEEGIASYQEKSKRYAAKSIVESFISEDKLLTMEELSNIKNAHDIVNSEIAEIFYAQAVSIVYFLMNKFEEYRFAILCKSLRENKSLDEALRKTYFNIKNTEDLYKQWLKSLNR